MLLTKQQKRKCVMHARDKPMIILSAIQETIDLELECINVPSLEILRERYKRWVSGKEELDESLVIEIFVASRFPNVRKEHGQKRAQEMMEFFFRRN